MSASTTQQQQLPSLKDFLERNLISDIYKKFVDNGFNDGHVARFLDYPIDRLENVAKDLGLTIAQKNDFIQGIQALKPPAGMYILQTCTAFFAAISFLAAYPLPLPCWLLKLHLPKVYIQIFLLLLSFIVTPTHHIALLSSIFFKPVLPFFAAISFLAAYPLPLPCLYLKIFLLLIISERSPKRLHLDPGIFSIFICKLT
jgi:hypothetical protein